MSKMSDWHGEQQRDYTPEEINHLNNEKDMKDLKPNDVFNFRFNDEYVKSHFEPYHCFDGILIARQMNDGSYRLVDTYWSCGDSKSFTLESAESKGTLEFLCNLDDMQDIKDYEADYYDDNDIVCLGIHAGYHTQYLIKKGTERSQSKMIRSIKSKIEDAEYRKRTADRNIDEYKETLSKIEAGDTSIYL